MSGGSRYWCYHCYGLNARARGACTHCGRPIEIPDALSFEQRLVWTLGHPDGDRAVLAARLLGDRRAQIAAPALSRLIAESRDPFLAAQALQSLVAIEGIGPLRELLLELTDGQSVSLSRIARRALASTQQPAR